MHLMNCLSSNFKNLPPMQKNTENIELTYSNCNSVFRRCQPDKICEFENIPENETLWSQISGVFLKKTWKIVVFMVSQGNAGGIGGGGGLKIGKI